jgi:hypothetical protein
MNEWRKAELPSPSPTPGSALLDNMHLSGPILYRAFLLGWAKSKWEVSLYAADPTKAFFY